MSLLDGLNDEQRSAARAVRGPVCILAGAGSGKTTTLTRRIANQVATGAFHARDVLALTFTDRAANELKQRLKPFGDVRARTFHAEALAQVAHFAGRPELVASKGMILGPIVRTLPRPYRFKPTKDVAAEIERIKNTRAVTYDDSSVLPPDLMERVHKTYEKRKGARLDFEDLLGRAIELMRTPAAETIRGRYKAFSVDEYQDVNLLQQTLLDAWVAGRDEICVVGDDYQSIYGFTGATPRWLVEFPQRYPSAKVITLTRNYRSTPQVLEVANRLTKGLRGREKTLTATKPLGPEVALASCADGADETQAIVAEIDRLATGGTPFEDIAILYRINARSDDYEEALAAARIPYQVRDGAFLRRPGPRALLRRVQRAKGGASEIVAKAARDLGWEPGYEEPEGAEEATRLADLGRLVKLAEEHGGAIDAFLPDLRKRFEEDDSARGVVLSTYHRAKGLEWDAVFLPRLEERELPFALSKSDDEIAEERRLLYVGITRARTYLRLSWARTRDGKNAKPSRFLSELSAKRVVAPSVDAELFAKLRAWRRIAADASGVPPYVVFHDSTLREICERRPASLADLGRVSGIGPAKLERYGREVLEVLENA
jgi:DNA helicase-2/ATP-dependent DNA helicase PcrA